MRRHLFNISALVSLVLCLVAGGSWASSYKQRVWRVWTGKDSAGFLVVASGQTRLSEQGIVPIDPPLYGTLDCSTYGVLTITSLHTPRLSAERMRVSIPSMPGHAFAGFEMTSIASAPLPPSAISNLGFPFILRWHSWAVPFWFWILVTAVLPVVWVERKRRVRRRRAMGLCLMCGYDLRASKDRCPECGTPVTATANKA